MKQCPTCNKQFKTSEGLTAHRAAVHGVPAPRKQGQSRNGAGGQGRSSNPLITVPARNENPPPNERFGGAKVERAGVNSLGLHAQIESRLGVTTVGREWAMRALHPCDDATGGGVCIPDLSADMSVAMENRHVTTLSAPAGTTNTWSAMIFMPPLADIPVVVKIRDDSAQNNEFWQLNWQEPQFGDSDLVTPGTVNIGGDPTAFRLWTQPTLSKWSEQFRLTFRGVTTHLISSALTNTGKVTMGQWGDTPVSVMDNVDSGGGQSSPTAVTLIESIPVNGDQLVQKVPAAGRWEARKGAYMVMRFNNPTHLYTGLNGNQAVVAGDSGRRDAGRPVIIRAVRPDGGQVSDRPSIIWRNPPTAPDSEGTAYTTAGVVNQQAGMILYEGLDKGATIDIKVRSGLELVAGSTSPWAPFMSSNIADDPRARIRVHQVQRQIPLAYEAKYNSLGALLGTIWGALQPIVSGILPGLGSSLGGMAARAIAPRGGRRRRELDDEEVD